MLLVKGILAGIFLSVPLGPVGLLTIRRTLQKGFIYGFISGLGLVIADSIYVLATLKGLKYIENFLLQNKFLLEIILGIGFFIIGLYITFSKFEVKTYGTQKKIIKNFFSTFFMALINIGSFFYFSAIYGRFFTINQLQHTRILTFSFIIGGIIIHLIVHSIFKLLNLNLNTAIIFNKILGIIIIFLSSSIIISSIIQH